MGTKAESVAWLVTTNHPNGTFWGEGIHELPLLGLAMHGGISRLGNSEKMETIKGSLHGFSGELVKVEKAKKSRVSTAFESASYLLIA